MERCRQHSFTYPQNTATTTGATSWKLTYLYDEQGRPYAGTYRNPGTSTVPVVFGMVTTDRGDVVELLDAAGNPFAAYRYDAWGNPQGTGNVSTGIWSQSTGLITSSIATDIAKRQVLRYASYCWDSESGLYYLSARSYDPGTRQFTSKDPARSDGEEGAYLYCGGDPVTECDPTGLYPGQIPGAGNMGIYSPYDYLKGRYPNDGAWTLTSGKVLPVMSFTMEWIGGAGKNNCVLTAITRCVQHLSYAYPKITHYPRPIYTAGLKANNGSYYVKNGMEARVAIGTLANLGYKNNNCVTVPAVWRWDSDVQYEINRGRAFLINIATSSYYKNHTITANGWQIYTSSKGRKIKMLAVYDGWSWAQRYLLRSGSPKRPRNLEQCVAARSGRLEAFKRPACGSRSRNPRICSATSPSRSRRTASSTASAREGKWR